jgi:hypothetical protein
MLLMVKCGKYKLPRTLDVGSELDWNLDEYRRVHCLRCVANGLIRCKWYKWMDQVHVDGGRALCTAVFLNMWVGLIFLRVQDDSEVTI